MVTKNGVNRMGCSMNNMNNPSLMCVYTCNPVGVYLEVLVEIQFFVSVSYN